MGNHYRHRDFEVKEMDSWWINSRTSKGTRVGEFSSSLGEVAWRALCMQAPSSCAFKNPSPVLTVPDAGQVIVLLREQGRSLPVFPIETVLRIC